MLDVAEALRVLSRKIPASNAGRSHWLDALSHIQAQVDVLAEALVQ
jgi:hypothetical protein